MAVGGFPVELLAYQVSMVCAINWPRCAVADYLYLV